jgi:hypothetical protein
MPEANAGIFQYLHAIAYSIGLLLTLTTAHLALMPVPQNPAHL